MHKKMTLIIPAVALSLFLQAGSIPARADEYDWYRGLADSAADTFLDPDQAETPLGQFLLGSLNGVAKEVAGEMIDEAERENQQQGQTQQAQGGQTAQPEQAAQAQQEEITQIDWMLDQYSDTGEDYATPEKYIWSKVDYSDGTSREQGLLADFLIDRNLVRFTLRTDKDSSCMRNNSQDTVSIELYMVSTALENGSCSVTVTAEPDSVFMKMNEADSMKLISCLIKGVETDLYLFDLTGSMKQVHIPIPSQNTFAAVYHQLPEAAAGQAAGEAEAAAGAAGTVPDNGSAAQEETNAGVPAASFEEQHGNWTLVHFRDSEGNPAEEYYLRRDLIVDLQTQDGETGTGYASVFIDNDVFTFCLGTEEVWITNYGEEQISNPVYISTGMGLQKETSIILPAGSNEWRFDDSDTVGGGSVNEMVVTEMRANGKIDLQIPIMGWGGRSDGVGTLVSMTLSEQDGTFHDLWVEAKGNGWKKPVG